MLPTALWAAVLDGLGEAGEVVRAASSCKALWAASHGPFKVEMLVVRCCAGPDLQAHQLLSLQQRFPHIRQVHVAPGSWQWTGCRTLAAWSATLTALQANNTSFPLAAVVQQVPQQSNQHAAVGSGQIAAQGSCQRAPGGTASTPHRSRCQKGQQLCTHDKEQSPALADVAAALRCLTQLHLGGIVTNAIKCRVHGSSECNCMEHTLLAALLQHNSLLQDLDLTGNSGLPDRLLRASIATASCSNLCSLRLSGCERVKPGRFIADAFPALQVLDVSDTVSLTDTDLHLLAVGLPCLKALSLRGCRKVSGAGITALAEAPALVAGCLTSLDLGCLTRTNTAAMSLLALAWATGCRQQRLGTTSTHTGSPAQRVAATVVPTGSTGSNSTSNRTKVADTAVASRLECRSEPALLHVGFSRTACVTDQCLQSFVRLSTAATSAAAAAASTSVLQQQVPSVVQQLNELSLGSAPTACGQQHQPSLCAGGVLAVGLCGLHLAGCNTVSGEILLQLGAAGALSALTSLDVSDMEAFRQPVQQRIPKQQQAQAAGPWQSTGPGVRPRNGDNSSSSHSHSSSGGSIDRCAVRRTCDGTGDSSCSGSSAAAPASQLPQLLHHARQHLQVLCLDGSYLDDASAQAVATQGLLQLAQLSLVGCRGLGNCGLRCLLDSLPHLRDLSMGGSVSAWSEGRVLQGLPVLGALTQWKLLRRPVLRDAELAPLLAAASSLRSLSLVGCYMLTDKLFEVATLPVAAQAGLPQTATEGQQQQWVGDKAGGMADHTFEYPEGLTTVLESGPSLQSQACQHEAAPVLPLQHLTQLCLTACDGVTGSSIARLKGLCHLRIAFCASLSVAALQHVTVGCTRLSLLELPASLSGQGVGLSHVRFDSPGSMGISGASSHRGTSSSRGSGGNSSRAGRVGRPGGRAGPGVGAVGLVLPQQGVGGGAGHLHRLRIVWL